MSRPIIDVCGVVYDTEGWEAYLHGFAEDAPGYLRHFGPTLAFHARADLDHYRAALARSPFAAVEVLTAAGGLATSVDDHVAELERDHVRYQVLHGGHRKLRSGGNLNDHVAAMAARHPHRLGAWAGLDPTDPDAARDEMDRCLDDLGMSGCSLVPFWAGVDPDDEGCHRIYARAAERGVPVWIHTGMNLAANRPLRSCTWAHIDRIASAHPDLMLVAGHGGWPWITEAMAVLQRHPHVYLDISAHRPGLMGRPGSGWEPLLLYGGGVVRHKVLFGTTGFVHRLTIPALAAEVASLGLDPAATSAWLHDNAARLLRVPAEAAAAAPPRPLTGDHAR